VTYTPDFEFLSRVIERAEEDKKEASEAVARWVKKMPGGLLSIIRTETDPMYLSFKRRETEAIENEKQEAKRGRKHG
jgi:hypothetical protein